ncbi:MAG: hypothetical protein U1F24_04070 [Alphaproteobacteria bacterium]
MKGLEIFNIVILGHAKCGGTARWSTPNRGRGKMDFLDLWMAVARLLGAPPSPRPRR